MLSVIILAQYSDESVKRFGVSSILFYLFFPFKPNLLRSGPSVTCVVYLQSLFSSPFSSSSYFISSVVFP